MLSAAALLLARKLHNDILAKITQLVGMAYGKHTASISITPHSPGESEAKPRVAPWVSSRIMLGLGLRMPTVPPLPPGICYRMRKDWNNAPKGKSSKQGPHGDEENVGQCFIEDVDGEPVTGIIAAEAHTIIHSCFCSLLWSGQVASSAQNLSHEARTYLHVALSDLFRQLLYCVSGTWKINYLIGQHYPGFYKKHVLGVSKSHGSCIKQEATKDGLICDGDVVISVRHSAPSRPSK